MSARAALATIDLLARRVLLLLLGLAVLVRYAAVPTS